VLRIIFAFLMFFAGLSMVILWRLFCFFYLQFSQVL
jgi:hypothetical protein